MKRNRPAPIFHLFRGETHIIKVMLVEELGRTVWTRRPHQRGNRVDDEVKIVFPRPQGLIPLLDFLQGILECRPGLHLFGDIHSRSDKFHEVA